MLRKALLISAGAGLAFAALGWLGWNFSAQAADLSVKAQAPAQPYLGPWTGFYGGVQLGYGADWSGTDITAPGAFATLGNAPHGLTGGGRLGYDYQAGSFVLGLVTDINLADFNSNSNTLGISVSNATNWWGSTNLRLGFSQFGDHLLPYAFGGLAYGGKKTDISGFSASTTSAGWDAGAGIETRITRNVSIFIEGKYVDLGGLNVPINPGMNLFGNQQFTFATITGGLNLRF